MRGRVLAMTVSGIAAALCSGCTILEGLPDVPDANASAGCGAKGEACCNGAACNAGLRCVASTCAPHLDASSGMKDASAEASDGGAGADVTHKDAAHIDAAPDASTAWAALAIVQVELSTGSTTASFRTPTTAGNLLVAMEPYDRAPSGSGWVQFESSDGSDSIYIWPDNPGGLTTFTIGNPPYLDVILIEFAGAPHALTLDAKVDTGPKGGDQTSLRVMAADANELGELELLYIDTNSATSASADSTWSYVGTDGNNNFGWWRTAHPISPLSATVTFSPASPASLVAASVKKE